MRKIKLLSAVLFTTFTLALPNVSHATLWQTARTMKEGKLSAGAYGQLYLSPTEFQAMTQGMYGLLPELTVEARLGVGTIGFYGGAFAKYFITKMDFMDIAAWGGFHTLKDFYLDFAPIMSKKMDGFDIYFGPIFQVNLSKSVTGIGLTPGISAPIADGIYLYGEFTLKITNLYNSISGGARYFF